MKKTVLTLSLLLMSATLAFAQPGLHKISVSQFVEHPALDAVLKGFQDYMKEKNIPVTYSVHNAQANMATAGQIANQIMGEEPDLILAIATPTAQTVAQALKKSPHMGKTPFLFTAVTDPVRAGLVRNLEKPGGNITGVSDLLPIDKHMENLRRILPNLKRLGVIYNSGEANSKATVGQIQREGLRMGFEVTEATVSKSSDVYQAAKSLVGRVDAIFVPTDNTVVSALESAIRVCVQNKTPFFCADVDSVARGAVAATGFDYYKHGYQTGAMAERIFNGAAPGDTPVETQKALELHLNLRFAEQMGVTVPEEVIASADRIYRK
ncbi:ABC transporter permease [Desulfonema ishimotonii]|uniref:ABC transporter permease n=1 Tax=Desulfonema ishimotonii TaxID=45657 RepID=A0A401FWU1_9BACT|nr:ABC transporter substrate-binding protein [Desulfonema ishimotonii]GBC61421.1 ABC transporter permease [Desulfonema ishimotonii]